MVVELVVEVELLLELSLKIRRTYG